MTTATAERPIRGTAGPYLLFLVCLGLVVCVGSPVQLISLPVGLAVTEFFAILLPAFVFAGMRKVPWLAAFRVRLVSIQLVACSLLLGISFWPLALAASELVEPLVNAVFGREPNLQWLAAQLPHSAWERAVWIFVAALLPGVCEETLFRGAIQGSLERRGPLFAVCVTAFLFALFHLNPWNFVGPLLLGFLFGLATIRAGSIIPAMTWHAASNATAFTAWWIIDENLGSLPWWVTLLSATAFLASGGWFRHLTQDIAREPSPLASAAGGDARLALRLVLSAASALVILVVACAIWLGASLVTTDLLAPELPRGCVVLILKNRLNLLPIHPNDVVSYRDQGKMHVRRVTRVSADRVWVADGTVNGHALERDLPRIEVIGKMIAHFDVPQAKKPVAEQ